MKITLDIPPAVNNANTPTVGAVGNRPPTSGATPLTGAIVAPPQANPFGAYPDPPKTFDDLAREIGNLDVDARRNYLAIMSNTMSSEDFARLQADGTHPGNTEIETVVTILDHIKAALVKGGTDISGYTDTLGADQYAAVTGESAARIPALSEGALKYMVENQLPPTIVNLYRAAHAGGTDPDRQGAGYFPVRAAENGATPPANGATSPVGAVVNRPPDPNVAPMSPVGGDVHIAPLASRPHTGSAGFIPTYLAQKPATINWEKLAPQIEKIITEAGLDPAAEENRANARWLVEKGLPLTKENLTHLTQLKTLELPADPARIAAAIRAALADGKDPRTANLLDPRSYLERAVQFNDYIQGLANRDTGGFETR
ncbi:MAG: DUF6240 domain-containing protein, partial [Lachnospiraceae bacterium]|nr:DUF6240 domain-containing protein [Lachnospiraceae bacterium]